MEETNVENPVQKLVESKMTTNFKISGCPMKIFNDFKQFALEEAGDNYSMAIKILLDNVKTDLKMVFVLRELDDLRVKIMNIESQNSQESQPRRQTFAQRNEAVKTDE